MSKLEDRMLEYRRSTDYRLQKDLHKYKKPFDPDFIDLMNKTAEYCIGKIQCCKIAYVQSDEISFFIDSRKEESNPFFEYRLCKLLSIIPSMATGIFNKLRLQKDLNAPLCEFDCKVWNVPTNNDVFAWFLYRQNDCTRNSKLQAAQSYLSHNQLWKEYREHTDPKYGTYQRSVYEAKPAWKLNSEDGRTIFMHLLELQDEND